ncbi:MAG TPA: DUF3352 domain-containing protein [Micromonosporaceae bacterium]|nr:DUF3352 domain-containing protein [Micromonosporaceae bacterium]
MSEQTPPTSGTPEPARAPEPIPSPWAAPPADANDSTYAPNVSDMTVSTADLSTTPAYQPGVNGQSMIDFGGAEPPAPRPGRRRAIVLSASTALLLLVGVGAYAGVRAWTGSGAVEPESAMPASVSAFVRVDFNPGYGDKLTVNSLVKKFPTHGKSTTDLVTKLETNVAKEAGLDYTTDVKPWFAGRAGVGMWTDGRGKPVALIALASTDDAKAEATLTKLRRAKGADSFGFAMEKGYALIAGSDGDMQATATAAAAAAKTATLADNATFKSAVAHVGDGNLLVAYADLGKVSTLIKSATTSAIDESGGSPLGALGMPGLGMAGGSSPLTGIAAVGGKVTGDGIEVRAHLEGVKTASSPVKVMSTLSAQPSATIVGMSTVGLDPASDAAKQLSSTLGMLANGAALGAGGAAFGAGGSTDDPFAGGSTDDPFAGDPTDPFGGDPTDPSGGSPGTDPLSGILRTAIPNVITPVLTAKQLTVAFTGLGADHTPGLLVNIQERDAATASKLADSVNQLIGGAAPAGLLKITKSGPSVNATVGAPVMGGSLGSGDLFKTTMAGMSDATSAGYVDVQKLIALTGRGTPAAARQDLAPVKSIGFGTTSAGTASDILIRVVIK